MAARKIYLDRSEMVLLVHGKNKTITYNLVSSNVNRIEFDKCEELAFGIIPKQSEKITIYASNLPGEVVYKKGENKAFFDQYKEELRQYAKDYRIPFEDKTQA